MRPIPADKDLADKKIKSSKTLNNYELKIAASVDASQNPNGYMKKVLSKNPVFMINCFNVHTIKYLFVSIFENIDFKNKKATKDNFKTSSTENKYFEDEINELSDNDLNGIAKYKIFLFSLFSYKYKKL